DPLDTTGRTVTKTFFNEWGDPVEGVAFHIANDNPDFDPPRYAVSNVNGQAVFSNVPVGNWHLDVDSVPAGYLMPENPMEFFPVVTGEDVDLTNILYFAQGITKTVGVAGTDDAEPPYALGGVNIIT